MASWVFRCHVCKLDKRIVGITSIPDDFDQICEECRAEAAKESKRETRIAHA